MKTVTFSTRLDKEDANKIDRLAGEMGIDRGTLLKQMIKKGYSDIQFERAIDGYKRGYWSLSRAAEMAGISIRDMLLRLPEESVELNYDLHDVETDIRGISNETGN